jgi:hypothetical protein
MNTTRIAVAFSRISLACGLMLLACCPLKAQPLTIYSLAGRPTPGALDAFRATAQFHCPSGVAADHDGKLYVADTANCTIRRIAPDGTVTTIAGRAGVPGSADGVGTNAQFRLPQGIALGPGGSLLVADTGNHTIRKITSDGLVSTVAGAAGEANSFDGPVEGARFFHPEAIAVDSDGDIYVSDTWNHTIRKITSDGQVITLAGLAGNFGAADGTGPKARFNRPAGLCLDSEKNVFVADFLNHSVRRITPAGIVTTSAGLAGIWGSADGTNSAARFYHPQAVVMGSAGEIFVLDSGNQSLRCISFKGADAVVTTVAGLSGTAGAYDGTASAARFFFPSGLAKDGAGDLHIADSGNNTLRTDRVSPPYLLVSRDQDQLTLKWPASFINFELEAAPSLSLGENWTFVSSDLTIVDDWFQFTTNTLHQAEFFRLQLK